MIKLIITDMDGTLLNNRNEINPKFWDVFQDLNKKGVIFSIASGRPYYNLIKRFENIKDNLLFICENGSFVMYKNQELYSSTIEKNGVLEIIEAIKKVPNIIPLFCGKNSAYTQKSIFEAASLEAQEEVQKYYDNLKLVENVLEIEDDFLKIAICDINGAEENSYKYFKTFEDKFQVVVSGSYWIDFANKGTNKGTAIAKVQKSLNITYDETMAFGDYLNDYEMMKEAKYSYAMKNAHPKLKEISNFITKYDNNQNGVVETIIESLGAN